MRRRPRQLSLKECYTILKLEKNADLQAVKRAYRRRAFELHPDLNPNNPEASQQFQLLNEAYVALSAVLKPAEEAARKKEEARKAKAEAEAGSREDAGQGQQKSEKNTEAETGQGQTAQEAQHDDGTQAAGKSQAYAEHDVLRDLLNDPFARRVFEDIYSELSRQQRDAPKQEAPRPETEASRPEAGQQAQSARAAQQTTPPSQEKTGKSTKPQQAGSAWGISKWASDMSKGGTGGVKGWLRRQIDEEQRLVLPAVALVPGRRIRLQIRQGFSAEPMTIEITLPPDFTVGKPIRLRGLGKKVGPWQGDLYLTILSQ